MTAMTDGGWRMTVLDALGFTDPGGTGDVPASAAHAPGWLDTVNTVNTVIGWVPNQVWAALLAVVLLGSIVTLPVARRQARKAGARAGGVASNEDRRDRALFLAAIVPASALTVAVLVGSQRGLVAFGRDNLHWTAGWEYLVPATLDGVGVAFAFLAFRAVRKERNPDRAVRVAWGAAAASAVINYVHESTMPGGSTLGGAYLALMSMFVMVMFHELLNQFVEGGAHIKRENPVFGLRWITWPTNTVCAWVAWRNYPVEVVDGSTATVKLAVEHLDEVRAAKRTVWQQRVAEGLPAAAWWTPVVPWVRLRQVDAALVVQRAERDAERAEFTERLHALETEVANALAEAASQRGAALAMEASMRAEMEAAIASVEDRGRASMEAAEERYRTSMESSAEALRRAEEEAERLRGDLKSRRTEAPRKPSTTTSRRPAEPTVTSRRKSKEELLEERVEAAKEALPLWKLETPSGPEIRSALGIKSDGVISDIRKRLDSDRLALASKEAS